MTKEFHQFQWDEMVERDCRQLVRMWAEEDWGGKQDWTTLALIPRGTPGIARVVARESGMISGMTAAGVALKELNLDTHWRPSVSDGDAVEAQAEIAEVSGAARDLLTVERLLLNLLGRMSGISTITQRYVNAISGSRAKIYDTRKTIPGWRRMEKYAVACGGGCNHRTGLFDAVLIKDNHLAIRNRLRGYDGSPANAVRQVRQFLQEVLPKNESHEMIVEVEVDTLEQLQDVLAQSPDIVLLDNMSLDQLRRAVDQRDQLCPRTQLEASGRVNLQTVGEIATTGVDRISVGALTHSAVNLDIGLDWGQRSDE